MSVRSDGRLRWLLVALVLVLVALLGVSGIGLFAVVSALASASEGTVLLFVALEALLPYAFAFVALSLVGTGLTAWLVVRAVRFAELPRSDRLARIARLVERVVPWLRDGGVSDRVAPTDAGRREDLKERYARGELREREFEREMERLLDDERDEADVDESWNAEFDAAFDGAFDGEITDEVAGDSNPVEDARAGRDAKAPSEDARTDHGSATSTERDRN